MSTPADLPPPHLIASSKAGVTSVAPGCAGCRLLGSAGESSIPTVSVRGLAASCALVFGVPVAALLIFALDPILVLWMAPLLVLWLRPRRLRRWIKYWLQIA